MRAPARGTADGEEGRIESNGQAHLMVAGGREAIHVSVDSLFACRQALRRVAELVHQLLDSRRHLEPSEVVVELAQFAAHLAQVRGARIGGTVDGMAKAGNGR